MIALIIIGIAAVAVFLAVCGERMEDRSPFTKEQRKLLELMKEKEREKGRKKWLKKEKEREKGRKKRKREREKRVEAIKEFELKRKREEVIDMLHKRLSKDVNCDLSDIL